MSNPVFGARAVLAVTAVLAVLGHAQVAAAMMDPSDTNTSVKGSRRAVPEIPVRGAAAALTLILGGTAIALDRRRRRSK